MDLAQKMQHLYQQFGQLEGVDIELHKRLIAIAIKNKAASATIFLQGAQITEFTPQGQDPVLWLSDECDYQAGRSLRGGIPICWPWFGDLDRNPAVIAEQYSDIEALPAHGLVRDQLWELEKVEKINDATTEVTLSLDMPADNRFPYPAQLQMTFSIGAQLRCRFEVKNSGERAFHFSSALHTYLAASQIEQVKLMGLEGVSYLDTLDDWRSHTQTNALAITAETDRIYQNLSQPVVLDDQGAGRQLSITTDAPDCVVWNPWVEKSKRLGQLADDAYTQMLCVESANVLDNICNLAPGERYSTTLTIASSAL